MAPQKLHIRVLDTDDSAASSSSSSTTTTTTTTPPRLVWRASSAHGQTTRPGKKERLIDSGPWDRPTPQDVQTLRHPDTPPVRRTMTCAKQRRLIIHSFPRALSVGNGRGPVRPARARSPRRPVFLVHVGSRGPGWLVERFSVPATPFSKPTFGDKQPLDGRQPSGLPLSFSVHLASPFPRSLGAGEVPRP